MIKKLLNLKNKIVNYKNKLYDKLFLFKEFINNTSIKEYKQWKLDDDKTLIIVFIEWFFNEIFYYIFIGLLFALALTLNNFIGLWFKAIMGYWLLVRLLLLIRKGE